MTFDGTAKFSFDGWNRLVSVADAYRDGSNKVKVTSTSSRDRAGALGPTR